MGVLTKTYPPNYLCFLGDVAQVGLRLLAESEFSTFDVFGLGSIVCPAVRERSFSTQQPSLTPVMISYQPEISHTLTRVGFSIWTILLCRFRDQVSRSSTQHAQQPTIALSVHSSSSSRHPYGQGEKQAATATVARQGLKLK